MSDWLTDVRAVLRGWRRSPGFSATIILTLVLGLGLASAIFAFADGYLFRPLPFPGADRTYYVSEPKAPMGWLNVTDTLVLRTSTLRELGFAEWSVGDRLRGAEIVADGRRVKFFAYEVSPEFRQTVPIPLIAGRDFTDEDHRAGGPVPAWISHRFWRREFGGSRDVIGREFEMPGPQLQRVVVVGIMGPAVSSFDVTNRPPDAVVPEIPPQEVRPTLLSHPLVRLPDDMSAQQAIARISAVLNAAAPVSDGRHREVQLRSLTDAQLRGGKPTARVLFAGALLVLLLATINLVHLLLTRGVSRAAEIATCAALGASRWRLSRLFLTESVMFGIAGIAGGLVVGAWVAGVIEAGIPRLPTGNRNMALVPMQFDARVMTFAAALGMLVALVGGLWPARRALQRSLSWSRRTSAGVSSGVSGRLSRSILASELAVATVVMVGTVFIGLGIWRYLNQPLGFDTSDRFRVGFWSDSGRANTSEEFESVVRAIRGIPGVQAAGSYSFERAGTLEVPHRSLDPAGIEAVGVSRGYYEAWRLRQRGGRWFEDREFAGAEPAAVVDQSFAALAFPGVDPVGQEVRVGGIMHRVVGAIEPRRSSLLYPVAARVYVPLSRSGSTWAAVVWAPRRSLANLTASIVPAVQSVIAGARVAIEPVSLEMLFLREVGEAQFQAPIMVAFGVLAFILAGVGVFGLVSYLVAQRTREFGIRFALGARPSHIWQSVIRQTVAPALIGLAIGIGAAWVLETVVRSGAFGWQSSGLVALTSVAIALLCVAVLAAAIPARRAMRIDPATTLRAE